MKKILLLILAIFALFGFGISNSSKVSASVEFTDSFLELNTTQSDLAEKVEKIISENSYPSYFGGLYIKDDSTKLVIQIVENNIPSKDDASEYLSFNKIISLNGDIEFEFVENSYKELNAINRSLIEYFSSEKANLVNLSAHYVDVFNNVVVIELIDNSSKQVEIFNESVLSDSIFSRINPTVYNVHYTQGVNVNYEINVGQDIGYCSMGFRAKVNGHKGYFTAAHCFSGVGDSSEGGTVKYWVHDGIVDAAFVKTTLWTNLFNPPTNDLEYTSGTITSLQNTMCPYLMINKAVAKSGYTTEYTSGQIKNLNYSGVYDGTYFTGLIAADFDSDFGDSGGGVFIPVIIDGGAPFAGIIKGSSSYGAAFVDYGTLYDEFEYSRY